MKIEGLLQEIRERNREIDLKKVQLAYDLALQAHKEQLRKSGEEYINHPLRVAFVLAKMNQDEATICAALLHDVIEDTNLPPEEIKKKFGQEILGLVQGVTKIGKLQYVGRERYAENLKKMILAVSEDVRVAFIKLADRLDNLKTLGAMPSDKQKLKARETMEIYAPIANRLGMGWLKGELEDLAFPYLYPGEYAWLMTKVKDRFSERQRYLKKISPRVERLLKKEGIKILKMDFRAKHYWSLYQKLKYYENDISKIYDLVAMRIIVPDVEHCYAALGAIHKYWPPLVGRVKDYIALPKPNGYQSIHTTVLCDDGQITEFQIRTPEMHEQAEYGISAHWYYSEQKGLKKIFKKIAVKAPEKNLALIKQLRNWQSEIKKLSHEEILSDVKIDFFKNRIFVFTPKGDVIELPEKSTPLDFAYAIHTQVGHTCALAKINGEAKSLYTELKNGDIVDIQTDKNRKPSPDWLNFVKTHHARSAIKKVLQGNNNKKENKLDILAAILPKKAKIKSEGKKREVVLEGTSGMLTYFPRCCNVSYGEPIIGYITRTKGVAIHNPRCKTFLKAKQQEPKNVLNADWK